MNITKEQVIEAGELAGKSQMKLMEKYRCIYCGKVDKRVKFYVIADDMENPKPYHKTCFKKFQLDVLIKLSELDK